MDKENGNVTKKKRAMPASNDLSRKRALQEGVVQHEDLYNCHPASSENSFVTAESYRRDQRELKNQRLPGKPYTDPDFQPLPSSIDGVHKTSTGMEPPKCYCKQPAALNFSQRDGPNKNRPLYACKNKRGCKFFQWAFTSRLVHWYRLGPHTGHVLVQNKFSAQDLVQGKVGDCWFLSALAVVAERPDLIARLFDSIALNEYGIVQLRLFVDGFWKTIVLDTFLPCMIDDDEEAQLSWAIQESGGKSGNFLSQVTPVDGSTTASEFDMHALSSENHTILQETYDFLERQRLQKYGPGNSKFSRRVQSRLARQVNSNDLAYSKAKLNQLWVPLLEKAYAKVHGCYKAISGGHIAEAFLDLTGAPTVVYDLQSSKFHGRTFWSQLLSYRRRRLPMGCGTSTSQAGIIGMHAYSILDVVEVKNVDVQFFADEIQTGTLGNVSGFTEFDGTVRLLRIRNPHGQGEWKGKFSDRSPMWERLIQSQWNSGQDVSHLSRSMTNDGVFWIDYDSFLLGFSNVDVVLAFEGNHAKSFAANFPLKKSNHRCTRAFEICLLDDDADVAASDHVECFVMGIQKNRRGSYHGRADRKKSYKVCDMGILVGTAQDQSPTVKEDKEISFQMVEGRMFGLQRNGHYRLLLDRKSNKRLVVMPISFGHPAATDKELSFVLRFVADAPVFIRELSNVPRMDRVINKFLFGRRLTSSKEAYGSSSCFGKESRVLLDDTEGRALWGEPRYQVHQIDALQGHGGTVFFYLFVNQALLDRIDRANIAVSFRIEATCRGMSCRTSEGVLQHETVAKGKMFEAAWRRYSSSFQRERKSRLLMTLTQSGQNTEMGGATCFCDKVVNESQSHPHAARHDVQITKPQVPKFLTSDSYHECGIFNGISANEGGFSCPFAQHAVLESPRSGSGQAHESDAELKMAMKLSKSEHMADSLAKAIAASMHDCGLQQVPPPYAATTPKSVVTVRDDTTEEVVELPMAREPHRGRDRRFSEDLKMAIQLSLVGREKHDEAEVIDLT